MDLQQLRTFVAIADAGGVTRAASRLNLSQPAATRQIQVLEAVLGVSLFVRIGRRVRLTSDGEDLLHRSRRVLAEADALRERAKALRAGDTGIVTVGATPPMIDAVLAGFLVGHRKRHPGVEIRIVEDGGTSLVSRLERGDVQLAYIPVGDDRFVGRLLYPIHVIAVVAEGSEFSDRSVLDIGELAGQQLLALRRGFGSRDWFETACEAANIRPSVLLESNAHNAILGLAGAGYGIGILPSATPVPNTAGASPTFDRQMDDARVGSAPVPFAVRRAVRRRTRRVCAGSCSRARYRSPRAHDPAAEAAGDLTRPPTLDARRDCRWAPARGRACRSRG
mgnify:CR=1 FL=1